MSELEHGPDFEAEWILAWYIDVETSVAYYLYIDCWHIKHRPKADLLRTTVPWKKGAIRSLERFEDRIRSGRQMCGDCKDRFHRDLFRFELDI